MTSVETPSKSDGSSGAAWPGDSVGRHLLILTGVIWTTYIIHSIARGYVRYPESDAGLLLARLAVWATAFALTIGALWVLNRMAPARSQLVYFLRAAGLLILPCAVLTLCNEVYLEALSAAYRETDRFLKPSELFVTYMNFGWIFVSWAALYAIMTGTEDLRRREMQVMNAQVASQDAQLAALRHQLQPHALFNALNAISALIHNRELDRAERTLLSFSDFLSHALTRSPREFGTVRDEIETARLYLEVEAVRFPDRLRVVIDVPDDMLDCAVPSLILQPLIENAVTHGLARSLDPVEIQIGGVLDRTLRLWVIDNARPVRTNGGGHGIGLSNVSKRLALLYDQSASLSGKPLSPGWRAEIVLPRSRAS